MKPKHLTRPLVAACSIGQEKKKKSIRCPNNKNLMQMISVCMFMFLISLVLISYLMILKGAVTSVTAELTGVWAETWLQPRLHQFCLQIMSQAQDGSALASFIYRGRMQRHVVHLYLQSVVYTDVHRGMCLRALIWEPFKRN